MKIGSGTAPHNSISRTSPDGGTFGSPEEITLSAHLRTALAIADEGDPATAARLLAEIAALAEEQLGADHVLTFAMGAELARIIAVTGDRAAGLRHLDALAQETESRYGARHTRMATLGLVRAAIDDTTAAA